MGNLNLDLNFVEDVFALQHVHSHRLTPAFLEDPEKTVIAIAPLSYWTGAFGLSRTDTFIGS